MPKKRKQRRSPMPRVGALLLAAAIVVAIWAVASGRSCSQEGAELPAACQADSLQRVSVPASTPQEMLYNIGYTVSFNPRTHQPNYAVWELLGTEASGDEPRAEFMTDPRTDASPTPDDYRYTGYDRGHMAPAGDMKWDPQAMEESFYMTNMCPQAPELNRRTWKSLEEKCRRLALADSAVIIVCGPIFDSSEPQARLGNTGVAVPDRFFKVVLSPYARPMRGIGFIMPNGKAPGGMQPYAVSIDSVEAATGYDFFASLPDDVERAVESRCNFNAWSHAAR